MKKIFLLLTLALCIEMTLGQTSAMIPNSPSVLVLTSTDDTPLFAGADGNLVGLNTTLEKITKVGPYIGTNIVFTLTAAYTLPAAQGVEATKYHWELPEGVSSADLDEYNNSEGNVIQVNFADVTPGEITPLIIKVYAVNDIGKSAVKTLVLQRALPKAPSKLVLISMDETPRFANADKQLVGLNTLEKITKIGPYIGTDIPFTLSVSYTAPPAQGSEVSLYHWTLPEGVYSNYFGGQEGYTIESEISIVFSEVPLGITDLNVSVQAINGNGASEAKVLVLKRGLPKAPSKLVLTSPSSASFYDPRYDSVPLFQLAKITKIGAL